MLRRITIINPHKSFISFKRYNSTTASIGKKIDSTEDLDILFEKSTWSTSDLLKKEATPIKITSVMLDGLLELSGLSKSIDNNEKLKIIKSLTEQLEFITKLHNVKLSQEAPNLTRLVDDKSVQPLTFDSLMDDISKAKPELSKGEVENSWNPLCLPSQHQNKYFLVKEGLIKKNK